MKNLLDYYWNSFYLS